MKPVLKIATHAAAALVGVGLAAYALPRQSPLREKVEKPVSRPSGAEDAGTAGNGVQAGRASRKERRSAAYQAAWAALAREPLGVEARCQVQRKLLAEWSMIDLSGALKAYLGEAWDNRGPFHPLAGAFAQAFSDQPLESWRALNRDPMARQLLGEMWIDSVRRKEPGLVIAMLAEIPANLQATALRRIFVPDAGVQEELIGKLAAAGNPRQVEQWMSEVCRQMSRSGDPGALIEKWTAMPPSGIRIREMATWANSLHGADPAKFAAEWAKVPAEDRGQAARLLLSQVDSDSPALTAVIERAVEAGQWDSLVTEGVEGKLRGFKTDRQALAEWALKLPPREETRYIFNLAISEKLLADPAAGRQWLEQLPKGDWHREWGFVEMTLGSMWVRGDVEAANRAIDAISDPLARAEAIKCRYDWQLITGQPNVIRVD